MTDPISVPLAACRILVVDDNEPWRRYVSIVLQKHEGLQLVGEATDGLEAVQKAIELSPDLVLLDVGLPSLNGLEAAKRIKKAVPDVKLLFATQTIDTEMMAEGLSNGAHGYIWKINAALELVPAIRAVRRGGKFVSTASDRRRRFRKPEELELRRQVKSP